MSKKSNSLLIIALMLFSIFSPVIVSAVTVEDDGIAGNSSYVDAITLDYPTYSISGTVTSDRYDTALSGCIVVVTDTFTQAFTTTDSNGNYTISGLHNDDYVIEFGASGHVSNSIDVTISDANVSELDITLHYITEMEQNEDSYVSGFMLIGGMLVSCLFIGAMYVAYNGTTGNIKLSQKQLRDVGYAAIYVVLFLIAVIGMASFVYR